MLVRRFPAVLILSLLVVLSACGKQDDVAGDSASTLAVTLANAEQRPIQRSVVVSGPVAAHEEMQLGVEISGARVTALNVDVGQQVRKNQVLLELDHRSLDSELAQAQASLREADAALNLASTSQARGEQLGKQQLISASQLDELRAQRAQADARRATARAQRDGAQLRRDFAELRAPADGIISKRLVQPGQVVAAGSELLRLIRDGRLEWRAELPEDQLAAISVGDAVVLSANGSTVEGLIRAVSPGVDSQTRTGTIYADLPAPGRLHPGTYVEGRIVTGAGKGLMVPTASVVERDGHSYVFTIDAKKAAHRLRVRTGATVDGRIEIVEGLKTADAVVEEGAGFLGDGDVVRVVDALDDTPAATPGKATASPAGSSAP